MATYYIATTGNDTTGNGSSGNPWATLNKAVTSAASGDTIIVNDGTYSGYVSTGLFGYFASINNKNLTISGNDADLAVFDLLGVDTALIVQNCDVVFNNITITNISRAISSGRSAIWNNVSGNSVAGSITFNNCKLTEITTSDTNFHSAGCFNGSAQVSAPAVSMTFNNCLFKNIGNNPNSLVFANGQAPSTTRTFTLKNCTFFQENDIDGIIQGDSSTRLADIDNCIFHNNTGGVVNLGAATSVYTAWDYGCAYNFSQVPGGTNNITSDPLFVDAANDNFNLRPTSPCIDAGVII